MKKEIENISKKLYKIKITTRWFVFGFIVILLTPLLSKTDEFLFGEIKTVVSVKNRSLGMDEDESIVSLSSIITVWQTLDGNIQFDGVFGVFNDLGVYKKAVVLEHRPESSFILNFSNIYSGSNGVICVILSMLWIINFEVFGKKKKKKKIKINNKNSGHQSKIFTRSRFRK